MFDIGWSEMAVIALLALLVIGPKELPNLMRSVARWVKKARSLTREFQSGIDEMVREAELEDARNALQQTSASSIGSKITDAIDPTGGVTESLNEIKRDTESTVDTATATPSTGDADKAESVPEAASPGPTIEVPAAQVAPAHSLGASAETAAPAASPLAAAADPEPASSDAPKAAGKTG